MEAFTKHSGIVAPLDRANVDTDAIIPKQFLKSVKREGFGPNLFDDWRYLDTGEPGMDNSQRPKNPEFVLNQPEYQDATILLTRENFGCGSSREHAPWALLDYGFRCIIAPSYADIFFNNCFKNGILPIVLDESQIDQLFGMVKSHNRLSLLINLPEQTIVVDDSRFAQFDIEPFRKHCLINGLDDIGLTLEKQDVIRNYELIRKQQAPWLFSQ